MDIKRAKLETIADFDALPEDEWVELSGGLKVDLVLEDMRVEDGKLLINLPRSILRQFKAKGGRPLKARIAGRRLIIEK